MISRRRFLATATAGLIAPLAVEAQQAGKVYRLGYLALNPREIQSEPFFQTLRALGYVEGRNLVVEYRHGPYERLPELAAELTRLKVDVLVPMTPQASLAAKAATVTIPIVFLASDPVAAGIVPSLAKPGANLTGVAFEAGLEIYGKQVEMLKQVVSRLSRVIVLAPVDPARSALLKNVATGAQALGVKAEFLQGREPAELDRAFDALGQLRGDALLVPPMPFFFTHLKWVVDLATRRRLPAVYTAREFVAAGGLMAYGPDVPALHRRVAVYVDKILKGAKPADLPVEQPTTFDLAINLKTAKALGLTIPQALLLRADEVVQ
jgi:putative ABC transport system substrate-binding protein